MAKKKFSRLGAAAAGAGAGVANGLFGAGGGMVLVPALQKLTDVEEESLFPTSVAVILPLCLVSLTVYGLRGDLPWQTAWPYLVGSGLGGLAAPGYTTRSALPCQYLFSPFFEKRGFFVRSGSKHQKIRAPKALIQGDTVLAQGRPTAATSAVNHTVGLPQPVCSVSPK